MCYNDIWYNKKYRRNIDEKFQGNLGVSRDVVVCFG